MAYKSISTGGDSWAPDPGDELEGEVVKAGTGESQYGEFSWVVVRTTDGNEIVVNGFGMILARALPQLKVTDKVHLQYEGMIAGGGGRTYKSYIVSVDDGVGAFADPE
jgi:hypothetical protein